MTGQLVGGPIVFTAVLDERGQRRRKKLRQPSGSTAPHRVVASGALLFNEEEEIRRTHFKGRMEQESGIFQ